MRRAVAPGSRIVLKIGSSSLSSDGRGVDATAIRRVVDQVEGLWEAGHACVLVTSGAVAAGMSVMNITERPTDLPALQVAAAVGQGRLMEMYSKEFGQKGRIVGQILLTRDVLARREQYLHAREALERMLAGGILPIVNENDTVVVDELRFGDNDRLAAIVSHLVRAGMLVILSDTAGLYSEDPWYADEPELLSAVRHTDEILDAIAHDRSGALGSGGVASKVAAARMAAWSGIPTVIAPASDDDSSRLAVEGSEIGTWVEPHPSGLPARKLWIGFGLPASGTLEVDEGARLAIVESGRSLLPAGVREVEGDFEPGSAVMVTALGRPVAKGLARMSAEEVRAAVGRHSSETGGVVIHRDDLVVLT
ncbi:MAG: glutamate 5-kinase [Acidimicrobiia bacterium]|nr:glutamate 5-kinase [Acidimicrobiia bacterium]